MKPGIYHDLSNEDYHASEGVSKSGLWKIYNQTPAHFKFEVREYKPAFDIGTAAHFALLQPELLEGSVMCGPADRRGNAWKDAMLAAQHHGLILLTAGDYETALRMRDAGALNATLRDVQRGAVIEASGYAKDAGTGILRRCRPDAWNPRLGIMGDLKSASDASPSEFGRAVSNFGYHVQEAFYTDTWNAALSAAGSGDEPVSAFVFIAIEKKAPFCVACYELKPSAVEEGRQIARQALATYAQCVEREQLGMPPRQAWPGYSGEIHELDIPKWGYRITTPYNEE